ncbi:BrnA antitoxin family protein [uncultured Tateyamaria sp.]|uniref:BrnA antitoxin family protein n=1 Tax=uncultured Tateyamaria sp. TaxID=455651 RepID=UPI0026126ADA|nr:BrnA antitoxin family protein [uncultured Tateyamaria sp.]
MLQSQRKAQLDLQVTLDRHQDAMRRKQIDEMIPLAWNGLDSFDGVAPHKTRVTIRLDADMVRWFRKLGPNYSQRMNDVLRIYWSALLGGQIAAHIGDDPMPRMKLEMDALARRLEAQREAMERGADPS